MASNGSEQSSYAALPATECFSSCFHGCENEAGGSSTSCVAKSSISSDLLKESGAALVLCNSSISNVDPSQIRSCAFQARKKRSYAGGAMGSMTGSFNGKHGLGGSVKGPGCPRDRLQRHRPQVSGTVHIPEVWCGELRLREWASSRDVEEALHPPGLVMARAALISARSSSPSASSPASLVPPASPACEIIVNVSSVSVDPYYLTITPEDKSMLEDKTIEVFDSIVFISIKIMISTIFK